MATFPRELAPDDLFYRAVPKPFIKPGGAVSPGAFNNTTGKDSMSVDWAELSTPEETIDRFPDWPCPKGVVAVPVQRFWDKEQVVEYDPKDGNPSHSLIKGAKTESSRKHFVQGIRLVHEVVEPS